MALLIFDIVLFPNLKGFVDDATINASWVTKVKKNKKNVPALCADVYYIFHVRHERKGGLIALFMVHLSCIQRHLHDKGDEDDGSH
jgi:hypothetical protein